MGDTALHKHAELVGDRVVGYVDFGTGVEVFLKEGMLVFMCLLEST